jgi:hypothetical protein
MVAGRLFTTIEGDSVKAISFSSEDRKIVLGLTRIRRELSGCLREGEKGVSNPQVGLSAQKHLTTGSPS